MITILGPFHRASNKQSEWEELDSLNDQGISLMTVANKDIKLDVAPLMTASLNDGGY